MREYLQSSRFNHLCQFTKHSLTDVNIAIHKLIRMRINNTLVWTSCSEAKENGDGRYHIHSKKKRVNNKELE